MLNWPALRSTDSRILETSHVSRGRAVYVERDGTLYLSRGYTLYISRDDGATWRRVTSLPITMTRRIGQVSRLASRLLRFETKAMAVLSEGTVVAANRVWIYYGRSGDRILSPCRIEERGQAVAPPMTLSVGPDDRILWGEYNSNSYRNPVRLYVSDDRGRSFDVAHVFEAGCIRHVHNLVYDERLQHYWVLAGDFDDEPGIGCLSADLKTFEWLRKGEQRYRAAGMFDFGDRLVYGTDTPLESNAIMSMEKASGRVRRVADLDGSCIYACRFGGIYALTTSVEPSRINHSRQASLWLSCDGENWTRVLQAEKDWWHSRYFQFGSLVLPRGFSNRETILFSGQAVKTLDGRAVVATLAADAQF